MAGLKYESPCPHVTGTETKDTRRGCSGYAGHKISQNVKRVKAARQHHLQGPTLPFGVAGVSFQWRHCWIDTFGPLGAARSGSDGVFTGAWMRADLGLLIPAAAQVKGVDSMRCDLFICFVGCFVVLFRCGGCRLNFGETWLRARMVTGWSKGANDRIQNQAHELAEALTSTGSS
jgi:hypothetical protein